MRAVPVGTALLVVVSGIYFQARGSSVEARTGTPPSSYVAKSSDGRNSRELAGAELKVGKAPDSTPLVSQLGVVPPKGGARPRHHRVTLSWTPSVPVGESNENLIRYNVYRCDGLGSNCVRINSDPIDVPEYVDDKVRSGFTYYYATAAVNQEGRHSRASNVVRVEIPFP